MTYFNDNSGLNYYNHFGSDPLYASGYEGDDFIWGNTANDIIYGDSGNDILKGWDGDDYLTGSSGDDSLEGEQGNDLLLGGSGSDILSGGPGNDRIDGFAVDNADYETNRVEYDTSTGGEGYDTFVLGGTWGVSYLGDGYATITDFSAVDDVIEVQGSSSQYTLSQANWSGTSISDTGIYYGSDLIAVVQDTIDVSVIQLQEVVNVGSLSGRKTFNDSVGSGNITDTYRFNIDVVGHYNADNGTQVQLSLYGMNADANLRLFQDSNSNSVLDANDELIASSSNTGSSAEYIDLPGVKTKDYFVEVTKSSGDTNYVLEMNTPNVSYNFTYYYGDGEYYKGYGYTQTGENFQTGQTIYQSSPNETGFTGYYVIDSANPTSLKGYSGGVVVTEYYDFDSKLIADPNKEGGQQGHMHNHPHNAATDINLGVGNYGLGSESGLAHIDGHTYGFDTNSFAVFSNYFEADLIPV